MRLSSGSADRRLTPTVAAVAPCGVNHGTTTSRSTRSGSEGAYGAALRQPGTVDGVIDRRNLLDVQCSARFGDGLVIVRLSGL